ncbi:hypothetical protein ISS05_00560 [Candidatus Woesearchaeota archaeon]|nr:hypothetical protein [Candidatus Woesearchaeota archaeon]
MSAEKEIVNYWYNKNGFFTINNIKAANRDIGVIALKFKKEKIEEIHHIEVSCSISGNAFDKNFSNSVKKIIGEKFDNKDIIKGVDAHLKNFSYSKKIKKVLVLGMLPKSRKKEIVDSFRNKNIQVLEFQTILSKVFEKLDTQYYKNDIIRTLQLVKYLVLAKPSAFAGLSNVLRSGDREEFLKAVLDQEDMIKEFRKTNEERLAEILKHVSVKNPEKLAELLQKSILNRRTRKPFFNSLLKMQGIKEKEKEIIKREMTLSDFF